MSDERLRGLKDGEFEVWPLQGRKVEAEALGSIRVHACRYDNGKGGVVMEVTSSESKAKGFSLYIDDAQNAHAFMKQLAGVLIVAWPELSAPNKAEQAIGPSLEALELAEEELDLNRRELKLGGSDPDAGLEEAHSKVTAAIALLKAVVTP